VVGPSAEGGRGLALLDGLIGLHGGTRGAASDETGHGKTVCVTIWLADGPAGDAERWMVSNGDAAQLFPCCLAQV
jgi:signal transduction histidine kinase